MNPRENQPNDITRQVITNYFLSPIPEKMTNQVLDCPNGYIIQEVRPHYLHRDIKTQSPFAKITYDDSSRTWTVFWRRASGKWNALKIFPKLQSSLEFIKTNPNGCFFS